MDTWMIIVIVAAAVVLLVLLLAAWQMNKKRRSTGLKEGFGSEYDREVNRQGRSKAESELQQRQKRVDQLEIRELTRDQASGYASDWDAVQSGFVDDPSMAVTRADELVGRVMQDRGYPVGEFDQRVADISVDHPGVASNYRAAHSIADRNATGSASTEELRQAMVHYRALFQELLPVAPGTAAPVQGRQSHA